MSVDPGNFQSENLPLETNLGSASRFGVKRAVLTAVHIGNFKSYGMIDDLPYTVSLAPLTLLYGANSAGKSTLLQALLALKQSLETEPQKSSENPLLLTGPLVKLGSFRDAIYNHDIDGRTLWIGVDYDLLTGSDVIVSGAAVYGFQADHTSVPRVAYCELRDGDRTVLLRRPSLSLGSQFENEEILEPIEENLQEYLDIVNEECAAKFSLTEGNGSTEKITHSTIPEHFIPLVRINGLQVGGIAGFRLPSGSIVHLTRGHIGGPEPKPEDLNWLRSTAAWRTAQASEIVANSWNNATVSALNAVRHLGPSRIAPPDIPVPLGGHVEGVGSSGERLAEFLASDEGQGIRNASNDALERLGIPYQITLTSYSPSVETEFYRHAGYGSLALRDQRGNDLNVADVGFGIVHALPIVVECCRSEPGIVLIQQPETHLHPALQTDMGELFLEAALRRPTESSRHQIIIETHSENILLRLQEAVINKRIEPDHVGVVFIDRNEYGELEIFDQEWRRDGNLDPGLPLSFYDSRRDALDGPEG
ncbi:AAA family ATPase [Frankia sp. Cas3]|uniref:AAA family ATPase n=1 Tax=Frankia sp. Cas3 TaxID=3073926 RepID=UPI002AD26436|nr:AAA family ATPase [Frankia sp. Cas3]